MPKIQELKKMIFDEYKGVKEYSNLSRQFKDKGIQKLFKRIAKDEEKHADKLVKLYDQLVWESAIKKARKMI